MECMIHKDEMEKADSSMYNLMEMILKYSSDSPLMVKKHNDSVLFFGIYNKNKEKKEDFIKRMEEVVDMP